MDAQQRHEQELIAQLDIEGDPRDNPWCVTVRNFDAIQQPGVVDDLMRTFGLPDLAMILHKNADGKFSSVTFFEHLSP